jgi:hypothetical protein
MQKASERYDFDREEKHEEESNTEHEVKAGAFKRTDKDVHTVSEYVWKFSFSWELLAFPATPSVNTFGSFRSPGSCWRFPRTTPRTVSCSRCLGTVFFSVLWLL